MSSEQITFNVQYNIQGIDESVTKTKHLLYSLNAVRLSIRDIQMVFSGPTIQNLMWTAIQLTRTYTHLGRLLKDINKMSAARGLFQTIFGAQGLVTQAPGVIGVVTAFAAANPLVAGAVAGTAIIGATYVTVRSQQDRALKRWMERQREIARTQGLES